VVASGLGDTIARSGELLRLHTGTPCNVWLPQCMCALPTPCRHPAAGVRMAVLCCAPLCESLWRLRRWQHSG
jgi:hypothetical protein